MNKDRDLLKGIAYVMSEDTLYDYLTVEENIEFYKSLFGLDKQFVDAVKSMLNDLNCLEYLDFLAKNLSQGTRNKIYLAIMLLKKATVLILDEPFTALDKASQEYFFAYLTEQNRLYQKTILIVTHIAQFKGIAQKIIQIKKEVV